MPEDPNGKYIHCDACYDALLAEVHEDEFETCQHKGCKHDLLCPGCQFTCQECGDIFCASDIVTVPTGEGRFAEFYCRQHAPALQKAA